MSNTAAAFVTLGVDVSKAWVDACLLPAGTTWRVPNTPAALDAWIATLPAGIALVVLEASGGYQNTPAAHLSHAGLNVAIVNPSQVRSFAKALGQRAKTDRLDARIIAQFAVAIRPTPRPWPTAAQAQLAELLTRRRQLQEAWVAERNRLGTVQTDPVRRSVQAHCQWLEAQVADVDQQIATQVEHSPLWRVHEHLLTSVPGVGSHTARVMLGQVPELGRLTRREIAALIGVAPFPRESGRWRGKRHIHGGRAAVRASLYMAALTAARCNPPLRAFYRRLIALGKPPKLALTAVMRKLLTILNAIIRDQQPWHGTPKIA